MSHFLHVFIVYGMSFIGILNKNFIFISFLLEYSYFKVRVCPVYNIVNPTVTTLNKNPLVIKYLTFNSELRKIYIMYFLAY